MRDMKDIRRSLMEYVQRRFSNWFIVGLLIFWGMNTVVSVATLDLEIAERKDILFTGLAVLMTCISIEVTRMLRARLFVNTILKDKGTRLLDFENGDILGEVGSGCYLAVYVGKERKVKILEVDTDVFGWVITGNSHLYISVIEENEDIRSLEDIEKKLEYDIKEHTIGNVYFLPVIDVKLFNKSELSLVKPE